MATATYTSTVYNNTPKSVYIGNQSVGGQLKWGAASTVADVGFLAKIPNGATIVDFYEYHSTGATGQGLSFGFASGVAAGGGANLSCLVASAAQGTMNRMTLAASPTKMPVHISVSDLDPTRYAVLVAKVESGTTTTSLVVNFSISYRMDGPAPA